MRYHSIILSFALIMSILHAGGAVGQTAEGAEPSAPSKMNTYLSANVVAMGFSHRVESMPRLGYSLELGIKGIFASRWDGGAYGSVTQAHMPHMAGDGVIYPRLLTQFEGGVMFGISSCRWETFTKGRWGFYLGVQAGYAHLRLISKGSKEIRKEEPTQFAPKPLHGYTLGCLLEMRYKITHRSHIGVGAVLETNRYLGQFEALPRQYGNFVQFDQVGPRVTWVWSL